MTENLIYAAPIAGALALLFAFLKANWVARQDAGTDTMKEIAGRIREGAMAFLGREYKVLVVFVLIIGGLLALANANLFGAGVESGQGRQSPLIAVSFVVGAFCSGLAGYFGMRVATNANVRTTAAARIGLPGALSVAFSGGTVMGMSVVGLAVVGLGLLYVLYTTVIFQHDVQTAMNVLTGRAHDRPRARSPVTGPVSVSGGAWDDATHDKRNSGGARRAAGHVAGLRVRRTDGAGGRWRP